MNAPRQAFTLIELLVAMAIFGLMIAALVSLEATTVAGADTVIGQANRTRSLQEASTYLASRLRAAKQVSTSLSVNGQTCSLTPPAGSLPCFAVLVSEARPVGGSAPYQDNAYSYLVFRLIPRSALATADKAPNSWADANTLALTQSQVVVCEPVSSPCTTDAPATAPNVTIPAAIPASLSITPGSVATHTLDQVVADMATLDLTPGSGTFAPFAYTASSRQFTLQFRQKTSERGRVRYTPAGESYRLSIQRRN